MGRATQNMFLQLLAVAVIVSLVVAYSRAGKDLMKGYESSLAAMQLNEIATRLDGLVAEADDSSGPQANGGFPYPVDYPSFCQLLSQEYPNKGEKAWKDHWDTDLYYAPFAWEEKPGYDLASAGPDRGWTTKDDLCIRRWGEKRWSENMGWNVSPDEEKQQ